MRDEYYVYSDEAPRGLTIAVPWSLSGIHDGLVDGLDSKDGTERRV